MNLNGELSFRTKDGNKSIVQSYIQDGIDDTYYTKNSTEGEEDGNYHVESFFELIKSDENPDKELYFSFSNHYSIDNEYEAFNLYRTDIDETENNYEADFNFKSPNNSKFVC